jgi:hypothetical protein
MTTSTAAVTTSKRPLVKISFSARGLKNINIKDSECNFTFSIGSRTCRCTSFVAEFLSPRVFQYRSIDDAIDELSITVNDPECVLESILAIGRGGPLEVAAENLSTIMSICSELWNSELYETIFRHFYDDITLENVVGRVASLSKMGCSIAREVNFISSHFHNFMNPNEDLQSLGYLVMSEILSNLSLTIASEDCLYAFIIGEMERSGEFCGLIEFIRFDCLWAPKFAEFFDLICKSFYYLTPSVWERLRPRLSHPRPDSRVVGPGQPLSPALQFIPSSPLNGIVAYLTRQCGGNVHTHGVVSITASSSIGTYSPQNAADLETTSLFETQSSPDSWICYDFKTMRMAPSHYSIRSYVWRPGNQHLRNWVLEGSCDGRSWVELDRRSNNTDLNDRSAVRTFPVSHPQDFNMIRLRSTGPDHSGHHYVALSAFEIFGSLHCD